MYGAASIGSRTPNFSADSPKGKDALAYFFTYSQGKGFELPFLSENDFISNMAVSKIYHYFAENLGYLINVGLVNGYLDDAEVKEAVEKAATEVAGEWNDRFSPQSIVQAQIDMMKTFKVRYIWSGPKEKFVDFAWNVYKDASTVTENVVATVVETSKALPATAVATMQAIPGIMKTVPYVLAALAVVLGVMYLKPKSRANPRRSRYARRNPRFKTMDMDELITEHGRLIKTLRTGSQAKRLGEASHQARELKQYRRYRRAP